MSETESLLTKIMALRQRLAQAQNLAGEARCAVAALAGDEEDGAAPLLRLVRHSEEGTEQDLQLDRVVGYLTPTANPPRAGPRHLTSRARRVLERGRELLGRLRDLAPVFEEPAQAGASGVDLRVPREDPLARLYREAVALTDTALRTVLLLPDSAAAQLHLCEGLEAVLGVAGGKLRVVSAAVGRRRHEEWQVSSLAAFLTDLEAGRPVPIESLGVLAEDILAEAWSGGPLRFQTTDPQQPARFVAAHALTAAAVAARVVQHDPDFRTHPLDAVACALVHDVGMLRVPVEILAQTDPLRDDQRRLVEAHCRAGAEMLEPLRPRAPILISAALHHHERLDGTGYPAGLRDLQVPPLARLLAVCDTYAALCCDRPHRPGRDTRTALTDTLVLAEHEKLDRHYAECLLQLSFYPVGAIVEMADGAVAVVVATPGPRRDLASPARPVVALLVDGEGRPLPWPRHVDLGNAEGPGIVRTLSAAERREMLGSAFPEWL
jgi:hypothetical protein